MTVAPITVERVNNTITLSRVSPATTPATTTPLPERSDATHVLLGDVSIPEALTPEILAELSAVVSGPLVVTAAGFGADGASGTPSPAAQWAQYLHVPVMGPTDRVIPTHDALFAVGSQPRWIVHHPDGTATDRGRRQPEPTWQPDLPERVEGGAQIPAGLWVSDCRDPAFAAKLTRLRIDADHLLIVVGSPGEPAITADRIATLIERLPSALQGSIVLAGYGLDSLPRRTVTDVVARTRLPIRVAHGLPLPEGHLHHDLTGEVAWSALGVRSVCLHDQPRKLEGWILPPSVTEVAPGLIELSDGWVAQVMPRGLVVRSITAPAPDSVLQDVLIDDPGTALEVWVTTAGAPEIPPAAVAALRILVARLADGGAVRVIPTDAAAQAGIPDDLASQVVRPHPHRPRELRATATGPGSVHRWRVHPEPVSSAESLDDETFEDSETTPRDDTSPADATPITITTRRSARVPLQANRSTTDGDAPSSPSRSHSAALPLPSRGAALPGMAPLVSAPTPPPGIRAARSGDDGSPRQPASADSSAHADPPVEDEPVPAPPAAKPLATPPEATTAPAASTSAASAAPGTASATATPARPIPSTVVREPATPPTIGVPGSDRHAEPARPFLAAELETSAPVPTAAIADSAAATALPPSLDAATAMVVSTAGVSADAGSTPAQRHAVRTSLGSRFDVASRAIGQLLAERPGIRRGGIDRSEILTHLAVVRTFATDPDADYDVDFHTCLAAGLRLLPTTREIVVRALPAVPSLDTGDLITLGAPIAASRTTCAPATAVETLIWTRSGRRLTGLFGDARDDGAIILAEGTRLTVVGVVDAPIPRLLLSEGTEPSDATVRRLHDAAEARASIDASADARPWFGALPVTG